MTSKDSMLIDAAARRAALRVDDSCIVRAPAGSGKTELLTQRYLALLATVEEPEEIIAITFTRKAAGEMRARIVQALELAAGAAPAESHKRGTWELARAAQARDAERSWQLKAHPARMRIQTIDSLNAELTRQMPLLSRLGAPPRVNERPQELYEEAARRSLLLLEEGDASEAAAVAGLARHLDNDLPRIHKLLTDMLRCRDQWLRHMRQSRVELEAALAREVDGYLTRLSAALPAAQRQELVSLAVHAGQVLSGTDPDSDLVACAKLTTLPPADAQGLPAWRGFALLLLTEKGQWRRAFNKNNGFPPEDKPHKARIEELRRQLEDYEELRLQLAGVPRLPEARYADGQWQVLEASLRLLPLAVAQLRLVFAERGEVDFAEVSLSALHALGEPEAPTDLALALDYRIRHLLVDEFQDTSINQFRLLEMLTAGWQAGDGRSLFLVGDPAQSIYRFREAEVGLFLKAWGQGLGSAPLTPLQLQANFRSRPTLVEWYNQVFPRVLPALADVASGAVPYGASAAQRESGAALVKVHAFFGEAREEEAQRVVSLIESAQATRPTGTVAVLARAKNHLAAAVRTLRRRGLHFQAVEVEGLAGQPVVQDLLALTRALAHPADRTAWLAVLRAPWSALSLAALHTLADPDHDAAIPARMAAAEALAAVHPRFAHSRRVLLTALEARGRGSLRQQVERTWLALGGPAVLAGAEALADAEAYLELLEDLDEGGALASPTEMERRLADLFARPDPEADGRLQLMTVHKAKGLEFDVVILPRLDALPRREDPELMVWLERPRSTGQADLLLAPLDAPGQVKDALYAWVRELRGEQAQLEKGRLLYVAATRAREELHLLGVAQVKEEEGRPMPVAPKPSSLLHLLWPMVKADFEQALHAGAGTNAVSAVAALQGSTRLKANWLLPAPGAEVRWAGNAVLGGAAAVPEFEWVGESLRHVGTVVHRVLQRIAEEGLPAWDAARVEKSASLLRQLLADAGVPETELDAALREVMEAVRNTLGDERGRWILGDGHREARNEYALSSLQDAKLVTGVMDRSFVDADDVRWIVDYKTSRHRGTDLEAFLEQERLRYAPQLERYAALLRGVETRRVKVALYFPLLQRFLTWEPAHGPES